MINNPINKIYFNNTQFCVPSVGAFVLMEVKQHNRIYAFLTAKLALLMSSASQIRSRLMIYYY